MRETFKNLKKVYQFGREYKTSLILQVVACIIGIIINVIFPLISAKFIVDFTNSAWKQAIYMGIVLLIVNIITEFKKVLIRKNTQIVRRGTNKNIQVKLGKELLNMEQADIDSTSSGIFIQRLINDPDSMAEMFTTGMGHLTGVISNIGAFIAILIINFQVFIYYLSSAIILTVLNLIKTKKYGKKDIEYRNQTEKVSGLTGELVRGTRDIKMLYAKQGILEVLDKNITEQNTKNFEMRNVEISYDLLIGIIRSIMEFGAILLLFLLAKDGMITVAIGIALYSYKDSVMTDLMGKVSSLLERCKSFNISCDRVFTIIGDKKYKKEKFGRKHLNNIKGDFEFKNVSFSYGNKKVLDNLNFKIEHGTTIGIVGKSGAGKTTIFNLLCKMYTLDAGEILIDNVNIEELDEKSIRNNITIISQNPYIFNMSIKDNLKLVKKDLTNKEMIEACRLACLEDYIETLPKRYDTVIGEGGVNLSGGQRQRLAIARALVQKTKIILFDESTSALDNETQAKIQQAIDNLKGEYTIIIIAHRISTIINCNEIMILEDGKIKEKGTHEYLLKNNKYYKRICKTEIINKAEVK